MKKILLLTVSVIISVVTLFAQSARFGVNGGFTFANMIYKEGKEKENSTSKLGLSLGFITDIPIGSNFSFQPGVNFVEKGAELKETEGTFTFQASSRMYYIETPFNVIYKIHLKKDHLFFGAGPSAAYAFKGKTKYKYSNGTETESGEERIKIGNKDDDELKPFELALNIIGGYEFSNGLQLAANYNRSLNNLLPGDNENSSLRNSYFGIKIGYMFGRKNK